MSIDLSLDRLRLIVNHLPSYTRPTVHIAGTNGKGSVAAMVSSILHASNVSFGRFNSPHMLSVYDCIVINDESVSPKVYESARKEVEAADKSNDTKLTSFEILALTALFIFENLKVEVAVVEVGMGGRLDATNIIPDDAIAASALTAVDLDHQAFLGATTAEIAKEKAGIARKNRPFVLGPQKHAEVDSVVKRIVESTGGYLVAAIHISKRQWDVDVDGEQPAVFSLDPSSFQKPPPQPIEFILPAFKASVKTTLPLYGDHQLENLGTAVTTLSSLLITSSPIQTKLQSCITSATIAKGIQRVSWPGRLSFHTLELRNGSPLVILADGAHNPASSTTLGAYITHLLSLLPSYATKKNIAITYIVSLSHSPPKTPIQTLAPILRIQTPREDLCISTKVAALRFSPPDGMPWVKSVPPAEIGDVVKDLMPKAAVWIANDGQQGQISDALAWAAENNGDDNLVVVAGSLYLVADFYRYLDSNSP